MSDERRIARSSGNVYADLGFDDPEAELTKDQLAQQIARIIAQRGWTQIQAAAALGIGQPKVSALVRGRLGGFSTDRLLRLLTTLDQNVTIVVEPKPPAQARAGITVHTH